MKQRVLAERYARALLMLGTEEKSTERLQDELRRFAKVVALEPRLLKILSYRELSKKKKEDLMKDLSLKLYLSPEIQNFFKLLLARGRMELFPSILEAFEAFVREVENVVIARVQVAEEQSAKPLLGDLKKALERMTSKKVEFKIEEDKSLIGGLKVRVGDTIYDASIAGELERIKENWI
ncbi:MAG: ATP synthase F1 subunit delta [Deltaproteobacteria bacterium]|nr:ATP synthase F1 subunit delta [Deltaproteobacteria bacterium]